MPDMNRFFQVEMCGERRKVVGVMIHVVSTVGLGGTAMPPPVVGYDAIAVVEEEHHLRVPVVRAQRPAVTENNGLTRAPIFEVNLRSVFGCD